MKKLLKLMVIATIAMTVIVACDKENDVNSSNASVIKATNVVDGSNDIATVKALVISDEGEYLDETNYWIGFEAATTNYEKGGFKLNLCATVPDKYLQLAYDEFEDFVTDRSAKFALLTVIAYNNAGREIGSFILRDVSDDDCYAHYLYSDRKFTMKGKEDDVIVDCNFKKGWNIMYIYNFGAEYTMTTKKPSGVNLKWHYYNN